LIESAALQQAIARRIPVQAFRRRRLDIFVFQRTAESANFRKDYLCRIETANRKFLPGYAAKIL